MIKLLFYVPTLLFNTVMALTPRDVFIANYKPSSDVEREVELLTRNTLRSMKYYLTK